ncbi:hypothetical protein NKK48_09435 [Mesorhizobium sp. C386A]|uniref:hypothetical protein n=1 Tax=unclassified Mesorhizobium TaxID=325217 RepID=UPI0012DC0437|nr:MULTISPECIES: hypothetical protein [unclassified Mesorhizobium]
MVDVTFIRMGTDCDMVAHAIFWRPAIYFATELRTEQDDLDEFEVASFCIGNYLSFDIRHYKGHPDFTCSLYFPVELASSEEIVEGIQLVIAGLELPQTAIAWIRGDQFEFGHLPRDPDDRLREPEARILALKIASICPGHTTTTSYVKKTVQKYYPLSRGDKVRSPKRRNEQLWQQIVGNVVSHKKTKSGPFKKGYAIKNGPNMTVTDDGLAYLNSLGFSST